MLRSEMLGAFVYCYNRIICEKSISIQEYYLERLASSDTCLLYTSSGLVPLHWHFSHPVCFMTGPRITKVALSAYQMKELFNFQRTWVQTLRSAAIAVWWIVLSLGRHRKRLSDNLNLKVFDKISNSAYFLTNILLCCAKYFRNFNGVILCL